MTGWTWDQIRDQLDLPRVYALREAWNDNPPLAITMRVAAEAMGAEFKGGSLMVKGGSAPSSDQAMPDPSVIMAELGQSAVAPYVAPRRGMAIPTEETPLATAQD